MNFNNCIYRKYFNTWLSERNKVVTTEYDGIFKLDGNR